MSPVWFCSESLFFQFTGPLHLNLSEGNGATLSLLPTRHFNIGRKPQKKWRKEKLKMIHIIMATATLMQ